MPIPFNELRQQIVNNSHTVKYLSLLLILAEGDLTENNVTAVIACLPENTSVEYLNFDGVSLKPYQIAALAQLLKRNTTLKVLHLMDQPINPEDIKQLVSNLATNTGLERLCLSGTSLDDAGIQALADALVQNRHLTELNINCCRFTTEGVKIFCDTLAGKNHTLQELRLDSSLDVTALHALTGFLKTSRIKVLYIGNPLDYREPERLEPLCELIRTAPLDKLIIVGKGDISYEDTRPLRHYFLTALIENTTLTAVEIGCCCLHPKFEWYLRKRNNEMAAHPEQREDICKKYRPELEKFLTKSPATASDDNRASHWHHPNHVQVNGIKAEGNESHDPEITPDPAETSSVSAL